MDTELRNDIREVVIDGMDYIKRVQKNIGILVDNLENNKDKAKENYKDLKEGLGWIVDALDNFGILLKLDYNDILICKQSSRAIIDNYKKLLNNIDELFEKGDYKKLVDIVGVELPKQLKKVSSIFNKVKDIVNGKEN